jgi:hypothetical protein
MKSIMMTYPGFQALPKGIKKMLLASESFFFSQSSSPPGKSAVDAWIPRLPLKSDPALLRYERFPTWPNGWRN